MKTTSFEVLTLRIMSTANRKILGKSSSTPRLRPGNEDDENDNFDNFDVQQKIVSKLGSYL